MEQTILETKKIGSLTFYLIESSFTNGDKNYSIKEVLTKGNKLLPDGYVMNVMVYDTLRQAKNRWSKL